MPIPSIFLIFLLLVSPTFGDDVIRNRCIKKINDARKVYAEQLKIANVNELEYDMGLEKMIPEIGYYDKCMPFKSGADVDYAACKDFRELPYHILMEPTRTKLACAQVCNAGFQIIADKPLENVINGTPGSKCPKGRVNKDGLCAKAEKDSGSAGFSLIILSILMAILYL